jgi:hypothetical protein
MKWSSLILSFEIQISTGVRKPDYLTTKHSLVISISDYFGIQMFTELVFYVNFVNFCNQLGSGYKQEKSIPVLRLL